VLLQRFHAAVQGRACDSQQFGCFANIALRHFHGGIDILLSIAHQQIVQIKAALLQCLPGIVLECGRHPNFQRQLPFEFRFQLCDTDLNSRMFGDQADDDVAQLARVAGEGVAQPAASCCIIQRESFALHLSGIEIAKVIEQQEFVVSQRVQRWHVDREHTQAME